VHAVVTIAAPCDPVHVTGLRGFLDDIAEQNIKNCLANLRKALLVFHSPTDNIVGIENASRIFTTAKHPKSFVSLAGADHLLSKNGDAVYVANVIAA
jgi:esterase/lipase